MNYAVYAGSFDPPTIGHEWIIRTAAPLFDRLLVAVGVNPSKKPTFTVGERVLMLQTLVKNIAISPPAVDVIENEYLVSYAAMKGVNTIIRGVRNSQDFQFEMDMRDANDMLNAGIKTVYLIPPLHMRHVSSSFVKGLIGPRGWKTAIQPYLSAASYEAVMAKYRELPD